jgi:hypothetical protein
VILNASLLIAIQEHFEHFDVIFLALQGATEPRMIVYECPTLIRHTEIIWYGNAHVQSHVRYCVVHTISLVAQLVDTLLVPERDVHVLGVKYRLSNLLETS